jgi:hypothetical protein
MAKKIEWFVPNERGKQIGRTTAELRTLIEGGRLGDEDKVRWAGDGPVKEITVREAKRIIAQLSGKIGR